MPVGCEEPLEAIPRPDQSCESHGKASPQNRATLLLMASFPLRNIVETVSGGFSENLGQHAGRSGAWHPGSYQ